jgi:IS30 family transposase
MFSEDCSPEQIAGRLKEKYPEQREKRISHETIYRYLYREAEKNQPLPVFPREAYPKVTRYADIRVPADTQNRRIIRPLAKLNVRNYKFRR